MIKDGLKHTSKKVAWAFLAVPMALGTVWLATGKARAVEAEAAAQAGAGAKATAPTNKAAPPATPTKTAGKTAASEPVVASVPKTPEIVGRRDPFKLPGPPVATSESGEAPLGPLPPGMRGLVISQLRLEGIVRLDTTNTMIAIVDNQANRAYFLRENDAVYNGVVAKITPDSVIFRENALDQSGKVYTRETVKRLGQGPGA